MPTADEEREVELLHGTSGFQCVWKSLEDRYVYKINTFAIGLRESWYVGESIKFLHVMEKRRVIEHETFWVKQLKLSSVNVLQTKAKFNPSNSRAHLLGIIEQIVLFCDLWQWHSFKQDHRRLTKFFGLKTGMLSAFVYYCTFAIDSVFLCAWYLLAVDSPSTLACMKIKHKF